MAKRFVLSLVFSAVFAVGLGPTAIAAPSDVSATFGPKAQFVTPTTILVPVTYECPASFGTGFVSASVSQSDTGGIGSGFLQVPCTGEPETVVLVVTGGPYTLGGAVLNGFMSAGGQFEQDIRRIQIVL